jgi:hypothetical protein
MQHKKQNESSESTSPGNKNSLFSKNSDLFVISEWWSTHIQQIVGNTIRYSSHETIDSNEKNSTITEGAYSLEEINDPRENIHYYPIIKSGEKIYISKPNFNTHINQSKIDSPHVTKNVIIIKETKVDDSVSNCSNETECDILSIEI